MPEPKKSPLPQAEMKPTPQNETVGAIASALKRAQQATSQYKVPEFIPLLGGTGMDEMLGLPGAASEVERWSYGDYPLTTENTGTAGYIPRIKTKKGEDGRRESRVMDLVDTAGVAAPLGAYAKKVGTNMVQTAPAVARDMLESAASPMRSYVIKPKGGNWLTPTDTRSEISDIYAPNERRPQAKAALKSMYEAYGPNLEAVQGNQFQNVFETNVKKLKTDVAIDDWINNNLTNYIKKEMATPEDPVRKLAEEGIHFMTPTQVNRIEPMASGVTNKRVGAGFPEEGMGKSQEAQAWEALSDASIDVEYADQYLPDPDFPDFDSPVVNRQLKADPWISKLNPDDPLYNITGNYLGYDRNIDFEKLVKSLREDVDEGAIRPEQLNKVSVADAVRRFYEKGVARQSAAFATRLERPAVKEYPEQGFRWIKLDKPGDFAAESDAMQHSVRGYEPYEGSEDFLRDLGGDEGYGLGGWDAIKSGDAEVYSLVDSKGRPHATIEVEVSSVSEDLDDWYLEDWFKGLSRLDRIRAEEAVRSFRRANPHLDELDKRHIKDALSMSGIELGGPKITQIKGKQNRPPNPEYQPFVQDFIKSREWSSVGELENANLIRIDPESDVAAIFRSEGLDVPKYISQDELTAVRGRNMGMAKGGEVKAAAKIDGNKFVIAAQRYGLDDKPATLNKIVNLVNKGLSIDDAARTVAASKVKISDNPVTMQLELAGGGAIKKAIERITKKAGGYGAKRLERAADEVPNLEKQFTEDALVDAFTGDNAKAIVTISPEDFEKYAKRLRGRDSITFADKQALDRGVIDKFTLPTDEYVQYLSRIKGLDDVPMLNLFKDETGLPMKPQITGHEGRHRSRALAKSGEPTSIVRVMPRGDLREGMPRRDQEEFIQALRDELSLSDRLVLPEKEDYFDQRPAISLPEVYAKGGATKKSAAKAKGGTLRMGAGGTVAKKIAEALAKGAAKDTAKDAPTVAKKPVQEAIKASEALGKYEGRPLVITQTDRTKTGGKWLGGPGFSSLQLSRPEYAAAEAAWGVAKPGAAKMIIGGGKKAGDNPLYTTMIGTPTQHQSNNMVFAELHRLFNRSAKEGNLDPELYLKINDRLRSAVDKNGNPVFPSDVDILSPKFRNLADTFDRRLVASNLMGGVGVGGKKGQIIDYDKIIRHTTDPDLIDAPSGALGNRLFTLTGNVVERPDLHPAFPSILQGEDLGVKFKPAPRELVMKDFADRIMREKGRKPGYMDYTRGHPPSQMLTEELLTELQKQGYKKGGSVNKTSTSNKPRKKVAFTDNLDTMRLAVGLK
jgi:hypothetical protein